MKHAVSLAVIATASIAALAAPVTATAAPHHGAASHATAAKPTGTIFFKRTSSKGVRRNLAVPAKGGSTHGLPGANQLILPVAAKHELVFSPSTSRLDVATYGHKVKHTYKKSRLGELESVSPNGKYVGWANVNASGTKLTYRVRTLAGKLVSTLFSASASNSQVWEAWNAASTQVAVLDRNIGAETASLKIYSRHGTLIRTIVKSQANAAYLAWSKSGTLAFNRLNVLMVVKSTGGTPQPLITESNGNPGNGGLDYSPNGKFLVFTDASIHGGNSKIDIASADGSGRHVLSRNGSFPTWG